ncbi:sensor histidine kinase, partial [Saccharothrix coeruleofusca]
MTSRVIRLLPTAYLVALDVAAAAVVTMLYLHFAQVSTAPLWLGYPLAFLVGAPLAVRRKWPLPVLAVVLTAQNAGTVADITLEMYTPSAFALYMVGVEVPRRRSVAALAVSLATAAVALFIGQPWPDDIGLALAVALVLASSWMLGRTVRLRRAYDARTAVEEASRAVARERLRIARELHDVVAHSLSVIAVKAGVANHVEDAAVAREALGVIERTSRGTLVEMRRLLGVLRDEGGEAELAPLPGLADLPDLAASAALAGVEVS